MSTEDEGELALVPAGYCIVLPMAPVGDWLVPRKRLVSLSDCLVEFLPGGWSTWCPEMEEVEGELKVGVFGYSGQRLKSLADEVVRLEEAGRLVPPSLFPSLDDLRAFLGKCPCDAPDLLVVAMCVQSKRLDEVIAKLALSTPSGKRTLSDVLADRRQLPPGGRLLGWEVLGEDGTAQFCSWQCMGIERKLTVAMGLQVNTDGLLDRAEDAAAVADYCNDEDSCCEPIDYIPWALVEFPRTA